MKSFFIFLFISSAIIASEKTSAQDVINLLDGHQIIANKIYYDSTSIFLRYDILKRGKIKQKSLDKLDIYSIDYYDKTRNIFYRQDSMMGCPLEMKEMENYIAGEREAIKNYKAPWVTVGGVAVGGVSAYFVGFWALSGAVVYGTGMGLIGPKVKTSDNISQELKSDKNFDNGYKVHATKIKVKNAIFGTALGIVAFITISTIYNLD